MIRCPLCEHVQPPAAECALCGKRFAAPSSGLVGASSLEGLELTQVAGGNVPVQAPGLPELEGTRLAAAPEGGVDMVPDLEPTRTEDVWSFEEPVAALPELDAGRSVDTGPRAVPATGRVMCRYCGNAQDEGLLCNHCGMRLPRTRVAAALAVQPDEDWVRCPACGIPARSGQKCSGCGAQV